METNFNSRKLARRSLQGLEEGFDRRMAVERSVLEELDPFFRTCDLKFLVNDYNEYRESLGFYGDMFYENFLNFVEENYKTKCDAVAAALNGDYRFTDDWVRKEDDENLYSYSSQQVRNIILSDSEYIEDYLDRLEMSGMVDFFEIYDEMEELM